MVNRPVAHQNHRAFLVWQRRCDGRCPVRNARRICASPACTNGIEPRRNREGRDGTKTRQMAPHAFGDLARPAERRNGARVHL